ncbi:3-phosphoshikimate 1-carboxyvinyltransferase [Patescibacteria group bacterium]|nr:3-phosphoshikimate 1-carboxyvinyltransferase [Patescibacteria group bacterium]MBU1683043.1 3-phosphoshikimate 1-carboxyvinyltransferase [Patescibacteria group bacterium]MBU1935114.1 3-phosphoshikimate 1-carboxyvinyltransferase [Patescibacteria group bacterium]
MKYREVIPLKQRPDWSVTLPGSKSITNRAFLCAVLANGKSRIFGALESDDTKVMLEALKQLGIGVEEKSDHIIIDGRAGGMDSFNLELNLHNAGTATRFLTALMVLRNGETIITGDKRMQDRPIKDLVEGLRQIGADIEYLGNEGCPPLRILNSQFSIFNKNEYLIKMKGDKSSQYFSALMMIGPILDRSLKIEVIGDLVSKPYIDITLATLKQFGIEVKNENYQSFIIEPQTYQATDFYVEGDASAASYWTSIAFLHEGKVEFTNLTKKSIQGDIGYEETLIRQRQGIVNMEDMPDVAMTLAVTAPFIDGGTKITGLSTLRIKETDRLAALEAELKKIGVKVSTTKDSITVNGVPRRRDWPIAPSGNISTYNDHRMAMCFAVVGTKLPGVVIEDPDCTEKTYPNFWKDLELAYLSPIKLGKKNLVLTGMRCSGKTRYGKMIAKFLNREFVDIDDEIERQKNMKIPEIVKRYGWPRFREVEQQICSQYYDVQNLVIATGGGVVLDEKNMKSLKKNGVNIFIFSDPNEIINRIGKKSQTRPSLTGKKPEEEIFDIWKERRDLYLKYADVVWDNTSGEVLEESIDNIFLV